MYTGNESFVSYRDFKYFFPQSVACFFIILTGSFTEQKFFVLFLMQFNGTFYVCVDYAFDIMSTISSLSFRSSTFSPKGLIVFYI